MHWNADLRHLARLAITRDVRHKRDGLRSQFHSSCNYLPLQSGSDVVYQNHPVRFFTPCQPVVSSVYAFWNVMDLKGVMTRMTRSESWRHGRGSESELTRTRRSVRRDDSTRMTRTARGQVARHGQASGAGGAGGGGAGGAGGVRRRRRRRRRRSYCRHSSCGCCCRRSSAVCCSRRRRRSCCCAAFACRRRRRRRQTPWIGLTLARARLLMFHVYLANISCGIPILF